MRTLLKILLVLSAVVLTTGATIYFFKTRLGPPQPVEATEAHYNHVAQAVNALGPTLPTDSLHRQFFRVNHLIGFLTDSQLLDSAEIGNLKRQAISRYVPLLNDWCFNVFEGSSWSSTDLATINRQTQWVAKISGPDGKVILDNMEDMQGEKARLKTIGDINKRYKNARSLCSKYKYYSHDSCAETMRQAKEYKNDGYLSNNRGLMERLDTLAARLNRSHFAHLKDRTKHLKQYRYMGSYDEVYKQYQHYREAIDKYQADATNFYGNTSEVRSCLAKLPALRDSLSLYRRNGERYYKDLESSRDSWRDSSSPSGFHFEIIREDH